MNFSLPISHGLSSGTKSLYSKAFLVWIVLSVTALASVLIPPREGGREVARISGRVVSIILCVVAFVMYRTEIQRESKYVFLNFSLFFLHSGFAFSIAGILRHWIKWGDEWSPFLIYLYTYILYFELLLFGVVYLVIDFAAVRLRIWNRYLLATLVTVGTSAYFFTPYVTNGKHLYSTKDIQDYKAIRSATEDLWNLGLPSLTPEEIAAVAPLTIGEGLTPNNRLTELARQARVSEILPYIDGDGYSVLIMRPLWWHCFGISLVCIVLIFFSIVHQYVTDPPGGAYFEKIVWCLALYCGFEVLHHFAFAKVTTWEMHLQIAYLGMYASTTVMLILLFLFIVRLRFIQSVEGRFYENRLRTDPGHVTRWRDAFDDWVLRQFMNPAALRQRFLISSRSQTSDDQSDKGTR
jgi:hypothetical protein